MEATARIIADEDAEVVFEDVLGVRHRVCDPSGTMRLEVLVVRPALTSVPAFEFALRERASRLAPFRHAAFARLHTVERRGGTSPGLRVVSEAIPGTRLSTLLESAGEVGVFLDISAALCIIRQLVGALAALHEGAREVAHGAVTPERLIVTPRAQVVVVEHMFGAALQQLRLDRDSYWTELRVALPNTGGPAFIDQRSDITQAGLVALSLILGRPLSDVELLSHLGEVVGAARAVSPWGQLEPLPTGLRGWLTRALQLDPLYSFSSAIDARAELDTMLGDTDDIASPASLDAFLSRLHKRESHDGLPCDFDQEEGEEVKEADDEGLEVDAEVIDAALVLAGPDPERMMAVLSHFDPQARREEEPSSQSDERRALALQFFDELRQNARDRGELPTDTVVTTPPLATHVAASPDSTPGGSQMSEPVSQAESDSDGVVETSVAFDADTPRTVSAEESPLPLAPDTTAPGRSRWRRAIVAASIVLAAAGVLGLAALPTAPVRPLSSGMLELSTAPAGVLVFVDGSLRGVTPLGVRLAPGEHAIEFRGVAGAGTIPITISSAMKVAQFVEMPDRSIDAVRLADTVGPELEAGWVAGGEPDLSGAAEVLSPDAPGGATEPGIALP